MKVAEAGHAGTQSGRRAGPPPVVKLPSQPGVPRRLFLTLRSTRRWSVGTRQEITLFSTPRR